MITDRFYTLIVFVVWFPWMADVPECSTIIISDNDQISKPPSGTFEYV